MPPLITFSPSYPHLGWRLPCRGMDLNICSLVLFFYYHLLPALLFYYVFSCFRLFVFLFYLSKGVFVLFSSLLCRFPFVSVFFFPFLIQRRRNNLSPHSGVFYSLFPFCFLFLLFSSSLPHFKYFISLFHYLCSFTSSLVSLFLPFSSSFLSMTRTDFVYFLFSFYYSLYLSCFLLVCFLFFSPLCVLLLFCFPFPSVFIFLHSFHLSPPLPFCTTVRGDKRVKSQMKGFREQAIRNRGRMKRFKKGDKEE